MSHQLRIVIASRFLRDKLRSAGFDPRLQSAVEQIQRCAEVQRSLARWESPRLSAAVGLREMTLSHEAAAELDLHSVLTTAAIGKDPSVKAPQYDPEPSVPHAVKDPLRFLGRAPAVAPGAASTEEPAAEETDEEAAPDEQPAEAPARKPR